MLSTASAPPDGSFMGTRRRGVGGLSSLPRRAAALLGAALLSACAHDVTWLADEPDAWTPPIEPMGFTIAMRLNSFDAKRLAEQPYVERFAQSLKRSGLFQGVIYPIPEGFDPVWELRLTVRDELYDPDSNFWKALFANLIAPLRLVLYQEEDYTLHVEAVLTRRDETVGTYEAAAPIRHRFQAYSPQKELQAAELLTRRSTDQILAALAADADRLDSEDRARAAR